MSELSGWPAWWVLPLAWTAVTLTLGWLAGYLAGATVAGRLLRALPDRHRTVTDQVAWMLRRRLPFWTLLGGAWLSLTYWPLAGRAHDMALDGIFVVGALSVTVLIASLASRVVSLYGARLAPGLPVSSLTRNIAWGLVTGLGILVVLNGLGVAITPMLTALGVGGLAVALAIPESLANFEHQFIKRLHRRFDQEGIVIPLTIRTLAHRA